MGIVDRKGVRPRLLIVGCSTRAAAWSAVRAGFEPIAADQFGDEDLRLIAEVLPTNGEYTDIGETVRLVSSAAWMYAGGMENRPDVVARLSALPELGSLLGGNADDLHRLRDPWRLQEAAVAAGLPGLQLRSISESRVPDSGTRWLVKPRNSGGGVCVDFLALDADGRPALSSPITADDVYLQQFVAGRCGSAVLLVGSTGVEWLGATWQLCGDSASSAPGPFVYCGSVGPVAWPEALRERVVAAVASLVRGSRFRGLLNVDVVFGAAGMHLLEVNPRYSASVEVLELSERRSYLAAHCRAAGMCDRGAQPRPQPPSDNQPKTVGKQVLYASRPVRAPNFRRFLTTRDPWSVPFLADIPAAGTRFQPGDPLCTVFATGSSPEIVEGKLRRRVARIRDAFETIE